MSFDHIPGEHSVRYFGRFSTGFDNVHYSEIQTFKETKHDKVDILAAAILAKEFNDNEYVKHPGKYEFVEYTDENGEMGSRYLMTRDCNRNIVNAALFSFPDQISERLKDQARAIIARLELEFMFKVLGDNMNDFEKSVHRFLGSEEISHSDYGVIAYIPFYDEREEGAKALRERSINSEYIGTTGGFVNTQLEVINFRESEQYGGYNVSAITSDGNRVSFFTSKQSIATRTGVFKINAKVKSFGTVWREPDIKETRLNYVKFA